MAKHLIALGAVVLGVAGQLGFVATAALHAPGVAALCGVALVIAAIALLAVGAQS